MESRNSKRLHRNRRVRAKISGTTKRPRLSVFRSLRGVYAQVIDDEQGKTLANVVWTEVSKNGKKNDIHCAGLLGELLAKKCKERKIDAVVFDRGGYKFHGKVKAVADGARKAGLNI